MCSTAMIYTVYTHMSVYRKSCMYHCRIFLSGGLTIEDTSKTGHFSVPNITVVVSKHNNVQIRKVPLCILPAPYSLSDFPVTVLEYSGPLDSLSSQDVDQKLMNSRLEECSVCVDTSVMRLVETVLSTSRTRCQRDLGKYIPDIATAVFP